MALAVYKWLGQYRYHWVLDPIRLKIYESVVEAVCRKSELKDKFILIRKHFEIMHSFSTACIFHGLFEALSCLYQIRCTICTCWPTWKVFVLHNVKWLLLHHHYNDCLKYSIDIFHIPIELIPSNWHLFSQLALWRGRHWNRTVFYKLNLRDANNAFLLIKRIPRVLSYLSFLKLFRNHSFIRYFLKKSIKW